MKRAISLTVVLVLILGGMGTLGIENADSSAACRIDFMVPHMEIKSCDDGYVSIDLKGVDTYVMENGKPVLPKMVKVAELPFGAKNIRIEFSLHEVNVESISSSIRPAPVMVPLSAAGADMQEVKRDKNVYSQHDYYPDSWYSYKAGCGLNEAGEHVTLVIVDFYPVRYSPADGKIKVAKSADVEIKYDRPSRIPFPSYSTYDMVIIAPNKFSDELERLVEHKNNHGISTFLKTTEDIYGEYNGRDDAEKIKYFIKNAVEQWGVKYVMLVGGRHGGVATEKWWCPVRYTNLDDGSNWEAAYVSDLYFADIYKYDNGNATFEDWDSNGNGKFAEWKMTGRDKIDFYPDVYVGRLACRNSYEVEKIVQKIITYETTTYGKDWFKKMVGIGGDTFPDPSDPYYDGELSILESKDYMEEVGIETTTLFTSDNTLTGPDDIINAVSQGCGFLNFEGHGNPMSWANHPPYDGDTWIGIDVTNFHKFSNTGMYPVCMIGGCHNSQFNVSILNLLKFGEIKDIYYKSEWSPESFGWWIVRMADKGAIASIGNTGLGYGAIGDNDDDGIPDTLQFYGGFIDGEFFRVYAEEGKDILGETHGTTLTNYIMKFPPMNDQIDAKTVEEWVLLGDPSLKIGGYPS